MPRVKKTEIQTSAMSVSSDVHRRVLQRCRLILLKDLDVGQVLESLCSSECMSTEDNEEILALPSRQQRVAVLLDRLEVRGQKAFNVFMESLREHYRHLHSVLDESVRNIDSMEHDDTELERVLLSGDAVSKLIKRAHADTASNLNTAYLNNTNHYIECFSVTKQAAVGTPHTECVKHMTSDTVDGARASTEPTDDTYMALLSSDLIFTLVETSNIPPSVKHPSQLLLTTSGGVYVADKDQRTHTTTLGRSVSSVSTARTRIVRPLDKFYASANKNNNHMAPPPVPSKPADLPPLSFNVRPPILKNRSSVKGKSNSVDSDDALKLPIRGTNPLPKPARLSPTTTLERINTDEVFIENSDHAKKSATDNDSNCTSTAETEPNTIMPPLPPRTDKLPRTPSGVQRPLSSVSEESGTPRELSPASVDLVKERMSPPMPINGENVTKDKVLQTNIDTVSGRDDYFTGQGDAVSVVSTKEHEELVSSENIASVAAIVEVFESKSPTTEEPPRLRKISKTDSIMTSDSTDGSFTAGSDTPIAHQHSSVLDDPGFTYADAGSLDEEDVATSASSIVTSASSTLKREDVGSDSEGSETTSDHVIPDEPEEMYEPVEPQHSGSEVVEQQLLDIEVEVSESESAIDDHHDRHMEDEDEDRTKNSRFDIPRSPCQPLPLPPKNNENEKSTVKVCHALDESVTGSKRQLSNHDNGSDGGDSMDSTFSDVDYEDIESVVNRVPPSSVSGKSYQYYLDPKSYTHNSEHSHRMPNHTDSESSGKILLYSGELLLAEHGEAMNAQDYYKNVALTATKDDSTDDKDSAETPPVANTENVDESNYLNSSAPYQQTKLCTDKMGRILYVPVKYLKGYGDPTGEPWFYPIPLAPRQATLFLSQENLEGCFVIYKPCGNGINAGLHYYQLSVCRQGGQVVHYGISQGIHGDVAIIGHNKSFMSVAELVKYFQSNKSQLITRLRRPLQQAKLSATPGVQYAAKWELNRNMLQLNGQIIGKGQFGVICGGTYHQRSVAVKMLQRGDLTTSRTTSTDDFLDEAQILMTTRHEHIVRLIGVSCSQWPHYIVLEYHQKGNLRDCLRSGDIPAEHIDLLFDLCIQVTSALTYLDSQRYIVHRDICARNFLVTSDLCVKLCNFGRARKLIDDFCHCDSEEKISIKWAAPEVMASCTYSTKSDIWSLGVVLWEVFSYGQPPYVTLTGEQTAVYVVDGGVLEKPPGCSPDIYSIMKSCWHLDPAERPTGYALADRLASKSSIYYGPVQPRPISTHSTEETLKLPTNSRHSGGTKGTSAATSPLPPPPPPKANTPGAGAGSSASCTSPTIASSVKSATLAGPLSSNAARSRSTVYATRMEEYTREYMESSLRDQSNGILRGSTSESSLNNAVNASNGKDDMTRSHKIRKSLRKVLHVKTTKRKSSNKSDANSTGSDRNSYTYNMYHNN